MGTAPRARAIHVLDAVILSEPWIHSYRMLHEHYPAILQHNVLYILLIIICILSKFQIPCLCFFLLRYNVNVFSQYDSSTLFSFYISSEFSSTIRYKLHIVERLLNFYFIFVSLKNCSSLREAYENHHSKKKEKEKNDAPLAYWARC